jgi:hypothetical protein
VWVAKNAGTVISLSLLGSRLSCFEYRLWGKLQIMGLGTALKVLFGWPSALFDIPLSLSKSLLIGDVF